MMLTHRDREILESLWKYRYLTIEALTALVGSRRAMYRRMAKLFHNGYVTKRFLFETPVGVGSPEDVYLLDREGARALQLDNEGRRKVENRLTSGRRHLKHSLALSRFQVVLDLAIAARKGVVLDMFTPDMEDRATAVKVTVGDEKMTVWPDATFRLLTEKLAYTYLVEIDQAERKRSRLEQRFKAYWTFVRRERALLKKTRGATGAFVLFVGPSDGQTAHLQRVAAEHTGIAPANPTFLFLNEQELSFTRAKDLLTSKICQLADRTPRRLVPTDED
jgi:hypothetical protein